MKLSIRPAGLACLLIPMVAVASGSPPEVQPLRNGFYVSTVDLDGRIVKQYTVDTVARLCFASNAVVPCENLKLRKEWKDIITWVSD